MDSQGLAETRDVAMNLVALHSTPIERGAAAPNENVLLAWVTSGPSDLNFNLENLALRTNIHGGGLQIQSYGFFDICQRFLLRISRAGASRKLGAKDGKNRFSFLLQDILTFRGGLTPVWVSIRSDSSTPCPALDPPIVISLQSTYG